MQNVVSSVVDSSYVVSGRHPFIYSDFLEAETDGSLKTIDGEFP